MLRKLITVLVASAAVGLTAFNALAADKKVTIYLLPKIKGVPYFETCAKGAAEAAKELGDTVTYDGPVNGKPEEAAKKIEQWTLQGADVIAVSANDPKVLGPAMKAAKDQGISVITWDADTAPDTRELFVNQATAEQIGNALVDTLAKDIGGGDDKKAAGEVAIVTATMTAANQNEWIKFMKARLANYPNLKLIAVEPSDDNQTKALQVTQDLIKAHPDLKGVWAISSAAFPGAAEAINAPQFAAVGSQKLFFIGEADSRPARRVEVLDNCLDVAAGLPRSDVPAGSRHGDDLQFWLRQRQANGQCVADAGINEKVDPQVWHDAIAVLLAGIKAERPADGFVAAIERCGAVLSQHFPLPAGTVHRPQLPDRLIEI